MTLPDYKYSAFERMLSFVSPRMANTRLRHRYEYNLTRQYLKSAEKSRVTNDWRNIGVGPNDVLNSDAQTARERAIYLADSNPYAAGARRAITDHVVGTGIGAQSKIEYVDMTRISDDDEQARLSSIRENERQNTIVDDEYKRWQEKASAIDGQHWFELQSMALDTVAVQGEVLRHRIFKKNNKSSIPLAYQYYEPARLTDFRTKGVRKSNHLEAGIEYRPDGTVAAYHIDDGGFRSIPKRIKASEIEHIYRVDRPSQRRGLTWFSPVIPNIFQLQDIQEYVMLARKIQSSMAVIISDSENGSAPGGGLPALPIRGESETTSDGVRHQVIEPGMLHYIGKGKVDSFSPAPSNDLDVFVLMVLRAIAVGIGLSYEWLTGDYTRTNFAGGKLGQTRAYKRINWMHEFMVRRHEVTARRDFIDLGFSFGLFPQPPANANRYRATYSPVIRDWGANPLQEVKAALLRISGGLSTLENETQGMDGDWQDNLKQIAKEMQFADIMNLSLHKELAEIDENDEDTQEVIVNG